MTQRGFTIPIALLPKIKQEGLTLGQMQHMLSHSAKITHPEGNRRFHDYVMNVVNGELVSFSKMTAPPTQPVEPPPPERSPEVEDEGHYRCMACKDTGKQVVYDECPYCEGKGCRRCNHGQKRNYIPCQSCTVRGTGVYRGR